MKKITQQEFRFPDMSRTFADFFSGCGGMSIGFIQAGMKCISAMDFDLSAVHSFWSNICLKGWSHLYIPENDTKAINKIRKWGNNGETLNWLFDELPSDEWLKSDSPSPCLNLFYYSILDIEPQEWMQMCGVRPGDIRIFIGGPPCQGFSTANTSRNEYDQRNQLPLRFIYYAKVCRPEYVIIENVPGLLSLGKKKGEIEGPFVIWIREAFDEAGYDMTYTVHDAANYGVPQRRKRVLFTANRRDVAQLPAPIPTHGTSENPHVTTREAIGDLPPIQAGEVYAGADYMYPSIEGHVICPDCQKYNQSVRINCWNCGYSLSTPIKSGVYQWNGRKIWLTQNHNHENTNHILRR